MRRFSLIMTVLLMGISTSNRGIFGQNIGETEPLRTAHYEIYSGSAEAAEQFAVDLEGRFTVYNRLFRFNPAALAVPLKVRLIPDTAAYDAYVQGKLGEKRPGAAYLHYTQAARRELVIDGTVDGEGSQNRAFPYHAFIQYLRAFIPNPPFWMQEGFAIFFSTLDISAAGEIAYEENLSWLEGVKKMPLPPIENIFLAGAVNLTPIPPADLSALSWSLVSFFLNSGNEDYFRTLLESFLLLSPDKTAVENAFIVTDRIEAWNGFENLNRDYPAYLASRKTFSELMDEGRAAYGAGDFSAATFAFTGALEQRPNHYAPYYYLGLIYYGNESWYWAEQYYNRSIELGADKALVFYALGLNAASEGLIEKAAEFLRAAAEADPARYSLKTQALLRRISGQ